MRKLIDLSHEIENGMITYRGLPGPVITDFMSRDASRKNYQPGTEFHIGRIEMVANTGTYVDSPFHRYEDGADLAGLPLESLADLDGVVARVLNRKGRGIGPDLLPLDLISGKALIIHTGWDAHWRTEQYAEGHPFVTREAAERIVQSGARLVGIDSFNIDDTADGSRPAHSLLLKAGIPIVEHLCNLESLPDRDFRFFAAPPRVMQFGSFPVRAFALCLNP
jgi:kynurenine formamidase